MTEADNTDRHRPSRTAIGTDRWSRCRRSERERSSDAGAMDVDAPPGFGAPGDHNPPPPSPGSANPNPPEPAAPIGLGASLPPLSPKQGGKDPSIVWQHFIKLAGFDPNNPRPIKLRECMDNVEDMDGFEIDTEIASVCPMPMEEDPSTVVLDDDE
ncbi:hypothetical protein CMV_025536 [Castanea mollissima]|uniref:Uncharacterized protein n=1 Tax=Castanea mollissima TaxID=60419 RepID=A0A8J4QD33_9ROSI|nr:hypothetical protein CMV_025536 [Castanea mollissima]